MSDRPLTTGEGNTEARARAEAWLAYFSGGGVLAGSSLRASEMARDVLALEAECGRLREQLDAQERAMFRADAEAEALISALTGALERLAEPKHRARTEEAALLQGEVIAIARAALGVEGPAG